MELDLTNWTLGLRKQNKKLCSTCSNLKSKQWKENNPDKVKAYKKEWSSKNKEKNKQYKEKISLETRRKHRVKATYGLEWEEFITLVTKADSKCQICFKPLILNSLNTTEMICVDHCHTTGKVRGILCNACNRGIGFLQDSTKLMQNAINYLQIEEKINE